MWATSSPVLCTLDLTSDPVDRKTNKGVHSTKESLKDTILDTIANKKHELLDSEIQSLPKTQGGR